MSAKIAFDATFAVDNHRGMGKFANIFLKNTGIKNKVVALLPAGIKSKSKIATTIKFGIRFYPLWEQISLPLYCSKKNIHYLVCPYNTAPVFLNRKVKLILVVHDLIFLEKNNSGNKESIYQKFGKWYRRLIVPVVIKKAYSIITVSEFSRGEIQKKFHIADKKIQVIPNTIDVEWFEESLPIEEREDYIFTVAGEALSKNLQTVIRAFALLKNNKGLYNYSLVVAGVKSGEQKRFYDFANELGIRDSITLLNYCSDDEMRFFYKKAKLFILGSITEGFGIPLLEAFAYGTPVVCSNTTSLPEIAGNAALFFDPVNPSEMTKQMLAVLENEELWKDLQKKGLEQVKKYHPIYIKKQITNYWNTILGL